MAFSFDSPFVSTSIQINLCRAEVPGNRVAGEQDRAFLEAPDVLGQLVQVRLILEPDIIDLVLYARIL